MKVGGYAHSRGITFYNKLFKVSSRYKGGLIHDDIQWIVPPKWFNKLEKVPLLGGIVVFYYQWKIFNNKMKLIYLSLILLLITDEIFNYSDIFANYYNWMYIVTGIAIILNLKVILRIFRFHGAEHKVINCYTEHGFVNIDLVKKSSRFNKRCGSNLVVLFLCFYLIMWAIGYDSLIVILFLLLLTIQVMKILNKKNSKYDKYINFLQYITVQEPKDEEIYLATQSFNKLMKATQIYQTEYFIKENNKDKLTTI